MWMDTKPEVKGANRRQTNTIQHVLNGLLLFTGDMRHLDKYMQDKLFVLQLAVGALRGVTMVILANNPLSGALILIALYWTSPWMSLLGALGVLASMLTALIIGQDSAEVTAGVHGYNGMLVALLMGALSSAGDWYWWLLVPACLGSATCVFLYSSLSSVLDRWDLPVSVFPFNTVIILYLLCTGPNNPYFPHYPSLPPGTLDPNDTDLVPAEVMRGVVLGVGQIYACEELGPSFLILGAVLLYSPLLLLHALLGSAIGILAGLSMAVRHECLYSGLLGFNGALGCMSIGGLCFIFNWRTHLLAIACAFFSSYVDIALGNLLGTVGLSASSWASTIIITLMLLLTGSLATYRIPSDQVMAPEHNRSFRLSWKSGKVTEVESTDVGCG
ncbi:urea transporter 1 isoform X2 [Antennarius striatus]|uniref:urea transporter 1 isoform X2 n=1 Tax=Antennarius striatus TaxID=241820 RepID=UPI0035B317F7